MAIVLTIAQQKGGAGKTSIAAHLAAALAAERRVAVLDIDPQRSLTRWIALRTALPAGRVPDIAASDVSGWRLASEIDRLRRAAEILIVDSPPHVDHDARRAVRAADALIVPIQPSLPDLWAAEGTLALAEAEKRRALLVLNRVPTGARALSAAHAMLDGAGHAALPAVLGNRVAFQHAFARGLGVTEHMPKGIAATETRALAQAVLSALAR